jgi:hypothetical protein
MSAILFALNAFNMVKAAVGAGMAVKEVYDMIDRTNTQLQTFEDEQRAPTDAEWEALNAESERVRALRPSVD